MRPRAKRRHAQYTLAGEDGIGRLDLGVRHAERVGRLVLLAPSLAWKRERRWAPLVRLLRPELGLLQITPRWAVEAVLQRIISVTESNWVRAGVREFLRAYLTPRGRVAFCAAAAPDLSRGAARREGLLDAPGAPAAAGAVHLGQA